MTPKELLCHYCQIFYKNGWMPGGGGAIALMSDALTSRSIIVTPESIPKDCIKSGDIFELRFDFENQDIVAPPRSQEEKPHLLAKSTPSFISILSHSSKNRCVVELCSLWSVLLARAALRAWEKSADCYPDQLRLSHWGLLKHLTASPELVIPIIESDDSPEAMRVKIKNVLEQHPGTFFILIRDYGLIAWGESLEQVKTRVECLEHLSQLQLNC